MNWIILKQPPGDNDTFPQIECLNHPAWTQEASSEIRKGNKFVLYDCDLSDLRQLENLCAEHHYVVLVHPDPAPGTRVRGYFTPERRKAPRSLPREADDETDFFSPSAR